MLKVLILLGFRDMVSFVEMENFCEVLKVCPNAPKHSLLSTQKYLTFNINSVIMIM